MSLIDKIPGLNDAELTNLLSNARRLEQSGSKNQQEAAAELLPALEAETAARRAAKLEAAAAKRPARKTPAKSKAPAKKKAAA